MDVVSDASAFGRDLGSEARARAEDEVRFLVENIMGGSATLEGLTELQEAIRAKRDKVRRPRAAEGTPDGAMTRTCNRVYQRARLSDARLVLSAGGGRRCCSDSERVPGSFRPHPLVTCLRC